MSYVTSCITPRVGTLLLGLFCLGLTSAFTPFAERAASFDEFTSVCLSEKPNGNRYLLSFRVTNESSHNADYVTVESTTANLSADKISLPRGLASGATSAPISITLQTTQPNARLRLAMGGYIGPNGSEWRTAAQVIAVPLPDCPDGHH